MMASISAGPLPPLHCPTPQPRRSPFSRRWTQSNKQDLSSRFRLRLRTGREVTAVPGPSPSVPPTDASGDTTTRVTSPPSCTTPPTPTPRHCDGDASGRAEGEPGSGATAGGSGGVSGRWHVNRRSAVLFLAASSPLHAAAAATATAAADGVDGAGSSSSSSSSSSSPSSFGSRLVAQPTSPQQGDGSGQGQRRERRAWGPVPSVALAPGLRVSKVMRGCWQLSGRHHGDPGTDRTTGGDAMTDLAAFHRAGITALDTADNYGPSEALIGQYLRLYPWNASSTTVATKLSYITDEDMTNVNRTLVEYAVRASAVRLGVRRLDLVQVQWADPVRHRRWLDVLKWLADLREQGLIGHIGLCNFSVPHLAKAAESGAGVVSNQVQYSLIDRRPQLYLQQAAASYGIKLLAYGTVAGGLLADRYRDVPAGRVRLDTASKQKYGLLLRQLGDSGGGGGGGGGSGGWGWMQEVLGATRAVAERHGVSSSAVATAWVLAQPQVAAAVVGARNPRHIRDMQAAASLVLDDGDMLDLDAVWEGVPNPPTSDVYAWERGGAW